MLKRLMPFIACLFSAHGFTQNNVEQLLFQHIAEKDGLSNNIVNCIAKDKAGFLWIGTFDGLNRFDGTHFITFRSNRNQPNSLIQNTVHGICFDNNDDVWCATQTGISCYHQQTQTFENFIPETKKSGVSFIDILCDKWGTIWCSSSNGLYEYISKSKTFRHYSEDNSAGALTSNAIFKKGVTLSPDKTALWIATVKGINQFDIASKTFYNYKNNPEKLSLFDSLVYYPLSFDKKGKLIYGGGSPQSILQYDFATNTITALDILFSKRMGYAAPPDRIFVDNKNRYWISTWGYTLFLYDPEQNKTEEFFQNPSFQFSISGNFFWDAYQDEEGTVWLGTINGLSFANQGLTTYHLHHPFKNSLPENHTSINRFFEDSNAQWWFTCFDKSSFYKYNPATGYIDSFHLKLSKKFPPDDIGIRGFNQYKNYLLFNTNYGVYSFNMNTCLVDNTPINSLTKLVGDQAVYTLKIYDSSVCLLAEKAGIIQYSFRTGAIKTISLEENDFLKRNIKDCRATVLANGEIYYLFETLKLARYNPLQNRLDTLSISLPDKASVIQGELLTMNADAQGNLWICLKGTGLLFYNIKTKESKLWQESDGLVFNHIQSVTIDRQGKVWCAAYNKFSVYDPAKNNFENFSLRLGESMYTYTSRFVNLHNGNILGNIDQTFIEWLPEKLRTNTIRQPVLINAFKVFDSIKPLSSVNNNVELNYNENNFSIEFGIITGYTKNNYRLQYMLEGFDNKWIEAPSSNTATYTNVPEKKLIFKVRAIASDNSWQGKETQLNITVIPPFYRTDWFRIIIALAFAVSIGLLLRLRVNNIRKGAQQKNEFNKMVNEWRLKALRSQMNPHFIFNCMNSIDLYILKNDTENASRYLNKFARLVRLILNQSDEMNIPVAKEIEMLKYYIELETLRFDIPFKYAIEVDPAIDMDETEIPSMLLQPYVENAILHGLRHKKETGTLTVAIRRGNNCLHCIIEDNGVGRAATTVINATRVTRHESKGMKLTEERLQMFDAQQNKTVVNIIDLKDEEGNATGTRVEIEIAIEFDD